ncbi:hypothetical protein [Saccharopolyspora elongata]|uniref:Uncharacterized protein n=1 Tax=Saccharopolyspora elongata TaxID=2530387 RepID=A0A4R4Y8V0_9PSEU|nr:hypothetical protein [Saccharopolyspora elongata]TDD40921.1 hypothetical protein E1288_34310 [Saccharopolyspora elongata]
MAHRKRRVAAFVGLSNQIHAQLDQVFPGLTGCYAHGLEAASLRVIMRDIPDPARVQRLGVEGLVKFVRRRGVRMTRPKATQIVETARLALRLAETDHAAALAVLSADVALYDALDKELQHTVEQL